MKKKTYLKNLPKRPNFLYSLLIYRYKISRIKVTKKKVLNLQRVDERQVVVETTNLIIRRRGAKLTSLINSLKNKHSDKVLNQILLKIFKHVAHFIFDFLFYLSKF